MDADKVVKDLKVLYPHKNIVLNKTSDNEVTEILCEIEPSCQHADYSIAIAIIDRSPKHKHLKTFELYEIEQGELKLYVEGKCVSLKKGDSFEIKPGCVHFAEGRSTWVKVTSRPGWNIEDYIII